MDDAFARDLNGNLCPAPSDAAEALRQLLFPIAFCSRPRPFGIHADLSAGSCPRCGWTPRRRRRKSPPA